MQERYRNAQQYFDEQTLTTRKYVLPYTQQFLPLAGRWRTNIAM
jgi:hypothetical protein